MWLLFNIKIWYVQTDTESERGRQSKYVNSERSELADRQVGDIQIHIGFEHSPTQSRSACTIVMIEFYYFDL